MNLQTQSLRYVLEVAACGSINRAAQNLFMSQPNLSTHIRALEATLGYDIFVRTSTGVLVTEKGEEFLKSARIIVSELENIQKIPKLFGQREDCLSVVCASSGFLLQCFIEYRRICQGDRSRDMFKETGLIQTMRDIRDKNYRIGFFYDFDCNIHKREQMAARYNLEIHPLCQDIPVMALLRWEHPLADRPALEVTDLLQYPLVTFEDFEYADWLGAIGVPRDCHVLYMFDRGGIMETIAGSNYIGVCAGAENAGREPHGIVTRPIQGVPNRLRQYWIKGAYCKLTQTERAFLEYVEKSFRRPSRH